MRFPLETIHLECGHFVDGVNVRGVDTLVELPACRVLVFAGALRTNRDVVQLVDRVAKSDRALLLFIDNVTPEAVELLAAHMTQGADSVCVVKAPGIGEHREGVLADIAALTGAQVIAEGDGLEHLTQLGFAKHVTVGERTTTIVEGRGDADAIQAQLDEIGSEMDATTSDHDKKKLGQRLTMVAHAVGETARVDSRPPGPSRSRLRALRVMLRPDMVRYFLFVVAAVVAVCAVVAPYYMGMFAAGGLGIFWLGLTAMIRGDDGTPRVGAFSYVAVTLGLLLCLAFFIQPIALFLLVRGEDMALTKLNDCPTASAQLGDAIHFPTIGRTEGDSEIHTYAATVVGRDDSGSLIFHTNKDGDIVKDAYLFTDGQRFAVVPCGQQVKRLHTVFEWGRGGKD